MTLIWIEPYTVYNQIKFAMPEEMFQTSRINMTGQINILFPVMNAPYRNPIKIYVRRIQGSVTGCFRIKISFSCFYSQCVKNPFLTAWGAVSRSRAVSLFCRRSSAKHFSPVFPESSTVRSKPAGMPRMRILCA